MRDWIAGHGEGIAAKAPEQIETLVAISSPSGDVEGADACLRACTLLLPDGASNERVPCSSPGHAPDLVARLPGDAGPGGARVLLLGHVDTVVAHGAHRAPERTDGRITGSGTVDMKGGVVLALGVLRALAERRADFAEVALLLVCDEEWRTHAFAHGERFAGWDACLCFEAGERHDGVEGVVVRRKAAGTLHVTATGRAAHSGAAPERGRNALLALASAAQTVARRHDPTGPRRLTAVPTVMRSGDAFNVIPAAGELWCDLRADDLDAIEAMLEAIPPDVGGATLDAQLERLWPGMDSRTQAAPLLERASDALGRRIEARHRGGASDASHFAPWIPATVDGLGPRGGAAHHPDEFVALESLRPRAEVALAIAHAAIAPRS